MARKMNIMMMGANIERVWAVCPSGMSFSGENVPSVDAGEMPIFSNDATPSTNSMRIGM